MITDPKRIRTHHRHRKPRIPALLRTSLVRSGLLGVLLLARSTPAQSPVTLVVDPTGAGPTISSNFSGLSYEMSLVLPGKNGKYFFSSENKPLVTMFRTMGIKSLRVGGNTAERETVAIPGKPDIDSLCGFARATGVKVIYTLRLRGADPQADAEIAKYVIAHYRPELACFTLGNEPEKMAREFAGYEEQFRRFLNLITAPTNAPEARFCGPSTTHKNAAWAGQFARDFGRDGRIALVTQHEYPGRSGTNVPNAVAGCNRLLSPDLIRVYESFHDEFVPAALSNGLAYRLEEANSFSNGGAAGVSDAFAAALWGLDYLYWWAARGASGINFHTGGYTPGTQPREPMKYAVFWNSGDGFMARPLAYALTAFNVASDGRLVPARLADNADALNLRAYAVLSRDRTLHVILINKEHGPGARDADVNFAPGTGYARGQVMFLTAPGADVQARSGVTFGGSSIDNDGQWKGTWTALAVPSDRGQFKLRVPAATGAVVKLTRE